MLTYAVRRIAAAIPVVLYLGKIVEVADRRTLFGAAKHPYSRALLSAVPVPDRDATRERVVLRGEVPRPIDSPSDVVSTRAAPMYSTVAGPTAPNCDPGATATPPLAIWKRAHEPDFHR